MLIEGFCCCFVCFFALASVFWFSAIVRNRGLGRNFSYVFKQAGRSPKGLRLLCPGIMFSQVRVKANGNWLRDTAGKNSESSHILFHYPPGRLQFYLLCRHWNNPSIFQQQLKKEHLFDFTMYGFNPTASLLASHAIPELGSHTPNSHISPKRAKDLADKRHIEIPANHLFLNQYWIA